MSLQNTPLLSVTVLRAMLWAGMRCPVGAIGQTPVAGLCPELSHYAPLGLGEGAAIGASVFLG